MRRALRLVAVACWGLAVAPMVPSTFGAAPGATVDAAGWWNRNQALPVQGDPTGLGLPPVEVPAPPTVPEDGLYVANDASGPLAVAAVRYKIDGQAGGTFTLHLAEGSALTGAEELVGCPVAGGFEAATNGRWDARPAYDDAACVLAATPTEAGDGLTIAVPATMASALGDISIAVVPVPGSTTPFTLAFTKPADGDFVVTTDVVSSPAAGGASAPAPAYSPGSPVYSAPSTQSPSFAAPSAPSVAAPSSDGASPEVAAPSVPTTPTVAAIDAAEESRVPRVIAIVALGLVGAALWWLGSQPQRAPRLLGSVGGKADTAEIPVVAATSVRPRGVGRFARPRSAAPGRL